jgi:hypothetical protein
MVMSTTACFKTGGESGGGDYQFCHSPSLLYRIQWPSINVSAPHARGRAASTPSPQHPHQAAVTAGLMHIFPLR